MLTESLPTHTLLDTLHALIHESSQVDTIITPILEMWKEL